MKRVGILALLHESNTFIPQPTTLRHFEENLVLVGEPVRERMAGTHHEVGGFFEGLDQAGVKAVPVFAARAVPYGTITAEAFDSLVNRLLEALAAAGPLDGLLVAPHGATVSERARDADGYWLGRVRQQVGPDLPIVGTLDPHANLSPAMVTATQALIAYRTNPHLDQRQRGIEAASLLTRTLAGEVRPTQAAVFPPMAINIERQCTHEAPCTGLYRLADEILKRPHVLSDSILLGFPYADVEEMGSAVLVVTDNQPALAQNLADELASYLWEHRQEFVGRLISVEDAVARASQLPGPVCLLDMGDNVGGGSPGDGTILAQALRQRGVGPAFVCLYDPVAVEAAERVGVGGHLTEGLGGKLDSWHGAPLAGEFVVQSLHEGTFEEPEPRHGGFTRCDQGQTAIVREGQLTVMLTSRRMPPFSLRQLTSCGIVPQEFQVLVAKGVNAPLAAYAPVCPHLLRVNTPGVTTADMNALTFHHRRRPMFPFEPEAAWDPRG